MNDKAPMGRTEALTLFLGALTPLPAAKFPVKHALGLAAAGDVSPAHDLPELPVSSVDGFALDRHGLSELETSHEACLDIADTVRAGEYAQSWPRGTALRVLTGASLDRKAVMVVPDEEALVADGEVRFPDFSESRSHIRPEGSLMSRGSDLIRAGKVLGPASISALVCMGMKSILAHPSPRLQAVATGDELVHPDDCRDDLPRGRRPASNLSLVSCLARMNGAEVLDGRVGPDSVAELARILESEEADIIVTTGGTARSERDITRKAAMRAGFAMVADGLALRPGAGCFLALRGNTALVALPGPPPAAFSCFTALVPPVINLLGGLEPAMPAPLMAELEGPVTASRQGKGGPEDVESLVPCTLHMKGTRLVARSLKTSRLDIFSTMIACTGVMAVPGHGPENREEGLPVLPVSGFFVPGGKLEGDRP